MPRGAAHAFKAAMRRPWRLKSLDRAALRGSSEIVGMRGRQFFRASARVSTFVEPEGWDFKSVHAGKNSWEHACMSACVRESL